jgi:hypothetical protein
VGFSGEQREKWTESLWKNTEYLKVSQGYEGNTHPNLGSAKVPNRLSSEMAILRHKESWKQQKENDISHTK